MRTFISEKSRTNSPEVYTLGEEMKQNHYYRKRTRLHAFSSLCFATGGSMTQYSTVTTSTCSIKSAWAATAVPTSSRGKMPYSMICRRRNKALAAFSRYVCELVGTAYGGTVGNFFVKQLPLKDNIYFSTSSTFDHQYALKREEDS